MDLGGSSDLLAVTGTLTLNGATINVQNSGGLSSGTYEIVSYGSLPGGFNASSLLLGSLPAGYFATVVNNPGGSQIDLNHTRAQGLDRYPIFGLGHRHGKLEPQWRHVGL